MVHEAAIAILWISGRSAVNRIALCVLKTSLFAVKPLAQIAANVLEALHSCGRANVIVIHDFLQPSECEVPLFICLCRYALVEKKKRPPFQSILM